MAIERMQGWTGARQNRAWTDLARLSVSVLIVGGNTVVGYIRHPWRHDVRQTTGCIFSYAFRDLSNLRWTVESTTDCGGHDNMNEMDAEVTHLRILANLKTREIVPQFNLAIRHPQVDGWMGINRVLPNLAFRMVSTPVLRSTSRSSRLRASPRRKPVTLNNPKRQW